MKVYFLTYNALPTRRAATTKTVGGLNTIVFHLSKTLAALPELNVGIASCLFGSYSRDFEKPKRVEIDRIILEDFSLAQTDLEAMFARLASLLQSRLSQSPPDLIHTSGSEAGYIMALARNSGMKIPWVHTNYATLAVRRVIVERLSVVQAMSDAVTRRELVSLRQCDQVIALSEVDKEEICEVFDISENKVTTVSPGVDRSVFIPGKRRGRESLVVSAGRMSKIKDFPFLLRSFRLLLNGAGETILHPQLAIIGGNSDEREELGLPRLAESLGLQGCISFVDGLSQSSLADYFRRAKVFVGSSLHETFGLLPVEARACGTPSVVRANSSYLATVKGGGGGFFAEANSEQDMAEKIAAILSLPEDGWGKMSQEAVKSANQYTWPRMARGCLSVYQDVLRRKVAP